tara:strand:+ start:635 stop:1186 length:552 start_codon:yes stop_codon:yes gene_type:complete
MIREVGKCENCGRSPGHRKGVMPQLAQLCVHEIANGANRLRALDKRWATLVLCYQCNGGPFNWKGDWPEARQLALLLWRRPQDFDLKAYNYLINPNAPRRIEREDIEMYLEQQFLSVTEAAARLKVDRRTVQSWIESEKLKAIDASPDESSRKLWRIHVWDFMEFLKSRATDASASGQGGDNG